ncbi:hypothetical protein BST28_20590 [Mycolicibacter kumamotonensis]|uniref:GSCFA domain-containing protein n=1 Tax=Mycolicibacter kumamotonensis TaxID=354243 RepID=A0A1X0DWJ8_9MYCO|nr:GSCFA domain-containing protein [Mycolicibacter kumamotonensis]ORA76725.1 hypothetical protein BST28_20590 [Mycolicibacter kumamotonensis]
MAKHPYSDQPDRAFWSRAVASNWSPVDLVTANEPILRADSRVMSAGSCFAATIVPHLEAAGYHYVRTETAEANDRFHYESYSAAYGNIYTPRQWLQLIDRAEGRFHPREDRWATADAVIDPFRPGLPYPAESEEEFDLLTRSHLDRVLAAIGECNVFIFTLGLTESWVSTLDGAVFPACPGTIAGAFDRERHRFVNFTASEVVADILGFIDRMRAIRPGLKIVLTVSPVGMVATATAEHVYTATVYNKSVLRAAAGEAVAARPDVVYFPSYEIATGPGVENHFADDRRTMTVDAVKTVVDAMLSSSEPAASGGEGDRNRRRALEQLSRELAERECEELMNDTK